MKISLQKLKQLHGNPLSFDESVDVRELEELDNDIRKIDPVQVKGTARIDGTEITFDFDIMGQMILPCARTLVDVPYDFTIHAVETFTTSSYKSNDGEVHKVDTEVLDLNPYIKENIILEIPFRVFAEQEVLEANTISEGKGWTLMTEEQTNEKIDPRLEKLKALLDDNNNESL
ncbi:YceD family protein [Gracilibacillus xinjiangensis]|uniref:YceD family protein n=1 Tax=Gracilibacillus xinjiangensis TaxID=1193282 RepID=A0ABV8WYW4_9BACI